jgi:hypothetical protein
VQIFFPSSLIRVFFSRSKLLNSVLACVVERKIDSLPNRNGIRFQLKVIPLTHFLVSLLSGVYFEGEVWFFIISNFYRYRIIVSMLIRRKFYKCRLLSFSFKNFDRDKVQEFCCYIYLLLITVLLHAVWRVNKTNNRGEWGDLAFGSVGSIDFLMG